MASKQRAPKQDKPEAVVRIFALENRLQIGRAIVARGPVDFPVKLSDAKLLVELGKARISGIW